MYKAYVTGVGWCWIQDGEIVEKISCEDAITARFEVQRD